MKRKRTHPGHGHGRPLASRPVSRVVTGALWIGLSVAGCQCSERRPENRPAPVPAAETFQTESHREEPRQVPTLEGCKEFLTPADVEKACGLGSGTIQAKLDKRKPCQRRFRHGDIAKASVVLVVREELGPAEAELGLQTMRKRAKRQTEFAAIEDIGSGAHRYARSKGKGERRRMVEQVEFAAGRYVAELRTTQDPAGKSLCAATKLPALAKVAATRLKDGPAKAANDGTAPKADSPEPTAEKAPKASAVGRDEPEAEAKAEPNAKAKATAAGSKPAATK